MRETGIGTSLILIASGAVLAFGVRVQSTAIDIAAIGAILIVVGIIGLLLSFMMLGDWAGWGRRHTDYYVDDVHTTTTTPASTLPHEHRRVETTDVVYEEDHGPRVERERRIHR
jgi:hypothetical protein